MVLTMVQSCSKHIINIIPLILHTSLWKSSFYYPWFADEETDPEEKSDRSQVSQLVGGEAFTTVLCLL